MCRKDQSIKLFICQCGEYKLVNSSNSYATKQKECFFYEIRCLTIAVQSRYLKCSLAVAKRGFYRAANSIFGKIGSSASDEVIMQLISSKCIPILLYGLEVLPMKISVKFIGFCHQ